MNPRISCYYNDIISLQRSDIGISYRYDDLISIQRSLFFFLFWSKSWGELKARIKIYDRSTRYILEGTFLWLDVGKHPLGGISHSWNQNVHDGFLLYEWDKILHLMPTCHAATEITSSPGKLTHYLACLCPFQWNHWWGSLDKTNRFVGFTGSEEKDCAIVTLKKNRIIDTYTSWEIYHGKVQSWMVFTFKCPSSRNEKNKATDQATLRHATFPALFMHGFFKSQSFCESEVQAVSNFSEQLITSRFAQ